MKITRKIKNLTKKVVSFLSEKQLYHNYKYSTSVHISQDVNKLLKKANVRSNVEEKVLETIH